MNIKEIKAVATQLTSDLKAVGVEIKHAQALEFIARRGGLKEWRALLAKLSELAKPVVQIKPRVLITVGGGVADYVCDEGVSVEKFDWDDFSDLDEGEEKDEMAVPDLFRDLAEPLGIPVTGDASEDGYYVDNADTTIGDRKEKLEKAGYSFCASDLTHWYWELDDEVSGYVETERQSIDDAWNHFNGLE